ncbi:hypothetical protein KC333_g196 [Hortaea werneckii]|nr:hypothetical protein KC333_g196 [Hortaea werneckii]
MLEEVSACVFPSSPSDYGNNRTNPKKVAGIDCTAVRASEVVCLIRRANVLNIAQHPDCNPSLRKRSKKDSKALCKEDSAWGHFEVMSELLVLSEEDTLRDDIFRKDLEDHISERFSSEKVATDELRKHIQLVGVDIAFESKLHHTSRKTPYTGS